MRRKYLDQCWREYERTVLPKDAPAIQRLECRRAFFAGAASLYGVVMKNLSPGEDNTEADMAMMLDVHNELMACAADAGTGATRQ